MEVDKLSTTESLVLKITIVFKTPRNDFETNFLKSFFLCSSMLTLFDQKDSKNSNIVKYYYNLRYIFSILIYLKMSFIPLVWTNLIFQQPSEIILICRFGAQIAIFCLAILYRFSKTEYRYKKKIIQDSWQLFRFESISRPLDSSLHLWT